MSLSNLSIMGFYNYNSAIFDDFSVPAGMDKQLAIDSILLNCAELEVIYTNYDVLKYAIKQWSAKELANWIKAWTAFNLTYNPIWNKDGTISETITDTETGNITRSGTGQSTGTTNAAIHNEDERTNTVAGYNSETLVNKDGTSGDSDQTTNTSATTNASTNDTENKINNFTHTSTRTETGNIGITTTQQMLREEYEIAQYNIYDLIVKSFKNRFCLLVY